ncbi:cytochrome P450 [Silicimonas algicola]|uniref:Cytochrome P450 n=1 Tax=Silicimonas algicola TaxID=1826607 RepID=A0A316GF77_9RHOB|nr:cytochrome P450 [Silicimonas algicola]AZQ66294.1 cytochrome P450 [Silicimonas algicola]PWK58616.1 cytochrome P450 [Silicimonas algicola]
MIPPKPAARAGRVSLWRYWRLFRRDILSAQPGRLYHARMAEFRTPFFRSFLVNEPDLVREVLTGRPENFPKSERVTRGLRPLLGRSVFVTNGAEWARQRRIIDPAFEGGRVRDGFPAMLAAAEAAVERVVPGVVDVEAMASRATADVIFRTLFSIPIEDRLAAETYSAFRDFQRVQPVAIGAALLPWWPVRHPRAARDGAARIRAAIAALVVDRQVAIRDGRAPDDLATKIMTTADPETGQTFEPTEMIDQVAIFFLAGHETSAALLGWTLWCLAAAPEWGERVAAEAEAFMQSPEFAALSGMRATRNVLREVLRLYPPVPMMVRETMKAERFRDRDVPKGSQVVLSPWHLGRHERLWEDPDTFDPSRWDRQTPVREAWLPFSAGPRVCPGAGFAMAEAAVLVAALMARFRFEAMETPVPVAHLTVRSRDGIRLRAEAR